MTKTDKATPRPWTLETNTSGYYIRPSIGRIISEANADLIVRAINNFEALLAALRLAYEHGNFKRDEIGCDVVRIIEQAITNAEKGE